MLLPEQASIEQVAALAAALPDELAASGSDGVLRVDASALRDFDTSTIALLMQARRAAQEAGRGFEVVGAPAQLAQLSALYGVEELLALRDTRAAGTTAKPSDAPAPLAALAETAAATAPRPSGPG